MGTYDQNLGWRVGPSSYGDLNGVMQYVTTEQAANQFNSLALEFDTQIAKNGDRLSVNEGVRSRPRQKLLRDEWETYLKNGHPYAALAAAIYTSTHDYTRGSAFDIGITSAAGVNRAPTDAEWAWIHAQAVKRGIRWTGQSFVPQEVWHHNHGYAESLPPYPNVRIANTLITETDDEEMISSEAQAWLTSLVNTAVNNAVAKLSENLRREFRYRLYQNTDTKQWALVRFTLPIDDPRRIAYIDDADIDDRLASLNANYQLVGDSKAQAIKVNSDRFHSLATLADGTDSAFKNTEKVA